MDESHTAPAFSATFSSTPIGFVGAGAMGSALIRALAAGENDEPDHLFLTASSAESTARHAAALGVGGLSLSSLAHTCAQGVIVLAVKPYLIGTVLHELSSLLPADSSPTIVSIAAGTPLSFLEESFGRSAAFIRAMPNVSASIGESMTALCPNSHVSENGYELAAQIFSRAGLVARVAEKDFAIFAALAGCSPAYTCHYIDALSRAGVAEGITKNEAVRYAAQAVKGTCELILQQLDNGLMPMALADQVQSPGGTTVAGILALEQAGFSPAVVAAVRASVARDGELAEKK